MEYKTLENTSIEEIHKVFIDSFSDYEINLDMPIEKLKEMILSRDIKIEYSMGCFDNGNLIAFLLCGLREKDSIKVCYDGGTGVIKKYQNMGIGKELIRHTIRQMTKFGVKYFLLEVLENNKPAINLYKKFGFKVNRVFNCYELIDIPLNRISHDFVINDNSDNLSEIYLNKYLCYHPSWQSDYRSISNCNDKYKYISLYFKEELIAFGFIHKEKGDIPQIGIANNWKNKEIEKILISILQRETSSKRLTVLNVEKDNYLGKVLSNIGFKNFINQYEMLLTLKI